MNFSDITTGLFKPFASFDLLQNVRSLGEQASKDVTGTTSANTNISEVGRSYNEVQEATPVLQDQYRDGVEGLVRVPLGDYGSITVSQWESVPRKIDAISDDLTGNLASIRYVNSTTKGDVNTAVIPPSSKFFLENVSMGQTEKYQLIETFGQYYVFFYGQRPPIYTFSGQLLNLENYNWRLEFMNYYQNYWRGTQSVNRGAMVAITFSYEIVYGYILNISTSITAVNDLSAPFSFQFLVSDIKPIPKMESFGYNLTPSNDIPQEILDKDAYEAAKAYHDGKKAATTPNSAKTKTKTFTKVPTENMMSAGTEHLSGDPLFQSSTNKPLWQAGQYLEGLSGKLSPSTASVLKGIL